MTTESGLATANGTTVPLCGVEVRAEVVAGHAVATVRQRYRNAESRAIEATYTFPLPSKGVVTGFAMNVGGRRLEGEVQTQDAAFRAYDDAVAAGHGGALLEQARPNVFSTSIGNLLPNEETVIEIQYVEPLLADEGAVRWSLPTLVAPRYAPPGTPDISPAQGHATYGLDLEVLFDLGADVDVASPSHAIVANKDGGKTRVRFQQRDVALDRDVVITANAQKSADSSAPIVSSVCHRAPGAATGTVAVMLVPDLGAGRAAKAGPRSVVFLVDRSGSMGGASMPEARTALKLCMRQLREGDRFNVLAFDNMIEPFANEMVPYTAATLARLDEWIMQVEARGGTELMAPMLEAARLAPDGIVVLITDGQVANEAMILDSYMAARGSSRVYSFGIGTNVSDALLHALADRTGGAVEMIYPGERIDEKVTAQFARATAPRISDVTIKTRGIDLGEITPATGLTLIDGEPCAIFATYEQAGRGAVEIRGKRDGENFYVEVAIDLDSIAERPAVEKLWAQSRIRDLERAALGGRRAETMKERIIELAKKYGVSSKYTSFVVVEKRTGDRRMNDQPEARAVPVNAPLGWAQAQEVAGCRRYSSTMAGTVRSAGGMAPPAMSLRAAMPRPAAGMPPLLAGRSTPSGPNGFAPAARGGAYTAPPSAPRGAPPLPGSFGDALNGADDTSVARVAPVVSQAPSIGTPTPIDPVLAVLAKQSASGLWEDGQRDPLIVTVEAMLGLVRLGLSSRHMIHGAQVKKAIDALLARLAANRATDVRVREIGLGVAWLLASGPRTRAEVELMAKGSALAVQFGNEPGVRAHVERLAV
jgi:Ca-activated chloride channel family protein